MEWPRRIQGLRDRQPPCTCSWPSRIGLRNGAAIAGIVLLALAVSIRLAASIEPEWSQERACGVGAERLPRLTLLEPRTGRLAAGEATCFGLALKTGEFVRIVGEVEAGYLRVRVLEPRRRMPIMVTWLWSIFYSLPLAFEAPASGLYVVELRVPAAAADFLRTQTRTAVSTFHVQIDEWLSARAQTARKQDLAPRPPNDLASAAWPSNQDYSPCPRHGERFIGWANRSSRGPFTFGPSERPGATSWMPWSSFTLRSRVKACLSRSRSQAH